MNYGVVVRRQQKCNDEVMTGEFSFSQEIIADYFQVRQKLVEGYFLLKF